MSKSCSIVIPAHNEGVIISETVQTIRRALKNSGRAWEIVVVDDGSSDQTFDRATAALEGNGQVLQNGRRLGKAAAIVEGVRSSTRELVLFTDADLSVPVEFFEPLVSCLDETDVAIASRHMPTSQLIRRQPWLRETCGEIFRKMVRRFFLREITDFTCGLKAFRAEAARTLFKNLTCLDWTFDVELLVRAKKAGMKVAQVPVTWSNRADTRVQLLSAICGSLASLWRIRKIYGKID